MQQAEQEQIPSVTREEGTAEAATIITTAMERARNTIMEVRRINTAKELTMEL